jgi:hypothetical protein
MTIVQRLRNVRISVDFLLRNAWSFRRPLTTLGSEESHYLYLQNELAHFLRPLVARLDVSRFKRSRIRALDVGAKNFFLGPVIERLFYEKQIEVEIHGIEIDAYRRNLSFRSRFDYAEYFCNRIARGYFHAMDFLKWEEPADVVFLLNPFVTAEPLLRWGLPIKHLQPESLLAKCREVLLRREGYLITSHPTENEKQMFEALATKSGFVKIGDHTWSPKKDSIQKQMRLGSTWRVAITPTSHLPASPDPQ